METKDLEINEEVWVVTPQIPPYILHGKVYSFVVEKTAFGIKNYITIQLDRSGSITQFKPEEVFSHKEANLALESLLEIHNTKIYT